MPASRTSYRPGQSGNRAGRPTGATDRYPRTARAAVDALLAQYGQDVDLLAQSLRRGLEARPPSSFPYLRLVIEQTRGVPDQTINVTSELAKKVIFELHPGPTKAR